MRRPSFTARDSPGGNTGLAGASWVSWAPGILVPQDGPGQRRAVANGGVEPGEPRGRVSLCAACDPPGITVRSPGCRGDACSWLREDW